MRWSRTLVLVALLVLIAACGSPAATTDGDGNGGDDGTEQSEAAQPTATPDSSDGGGDDGGGDDGGGDDGGGDGPSSGDLEGVLNGLVPPNSTQIQRTDADNIIFVIYESSDSPESLADHYPDAIADTGMEVISTTSAGGSYSWLFAENESSSFGGAVSVGPAADGGSGSSVSVQVSNGG
jgi:hypothetical protein